MAKNKTTKYNINSMCDIVDAYTSRCKKGLDGGSIDYPILKEVCCENGWDYVYVNHLCTNDKINGDKLRLSINRCLQLKEVALERLGSKGKIDRGMAIFSLKQLGWTDVQKVDQNTMVQVKFVGENKIED